MRTKKRFLSLLLCGALLFSGLPQAAFAENGNGSGQTTGGGENPKDIFDLEDFADGTIGIISVKDKSQSDFTIPALIDGKPVTAIMEEAFTVCASNLRSVTFEAESKLTTIGNNAFSNCDSLDSINLPASLQSIGESTFYNCGSLGSIDLPTSLQSIGENAFASCGLESITIPASVATIGEAAFSGCRLTSVTFESPEESKLSVIETDVFKDCILESITIPASVTTIENGPFGELDEVIFPANSQIQTIDPDALLQVKQLYHYNNEIVAKYAEENKLTAINLGPELTVWVSDGGTAGALPAKPNGGASVTLTAKPEEGFHFVEWEVRSGNVTITTNPDNKLTATFTMPENSVEITAVFEEHTYNWTPNNDGTHTGTCQNTDCNKQETENCSYVNGVCETCGYVLISIDTQPQDQTVTVGNTAAFTVKATGDNLSYQWQESADGSVWADISGATADSYTTPAATMDMNGRKYRVVVSENNVSVTSEAAMLTVNPAALDTPDNLLLNGGSGEVTATWNAVDHADGYSVQLYKDSAVYGSPVSTDKTTCTFTIKEAGSYTFTVTAEGEDNYTDSPQSGQSAAVTFYAVSFDTDDGTVLPQQIIAAGGKAQKPADPEKTGYTFKGWYNGDSEWNFDTDTVNSAVTLFAKWEAHSYSVSVSPDKLTFESITYGGAVPEAQTVTVKNTGNRSITLNQSAAEHFTIGTLSATTLTPGAEAAFTVQPKAGLDVGNYEDTISISGGNGVSGSVKATFTVEKAGEPTPPTQHRITVNTEGSGTAKADKSTAKAGTEITLTQTAGSGWHFKEWKVSPETVKITDSKFTMPDEAVTVTAVFEKDGGSGGGTEPGGDTNPDEGGNKPGGGSGSGGGATSPGDETSSTGETGAAQQAKKLTAPKKVTVSPSYNKVKVSWKKVAGATGYQVYRAAKKNGKYKKVKTTKARTWTNRKLKTGKTWYYKVRAYKKEKGKAVYSKFSARKKVKVRPAAPTLKVRANKGAITAKWSSVAGATRYQLYRAAKKNGKYYRWRETVKRGYVDRKKLREGTVYYYKARAYRVVKGKKIYGKFSEVKKVGAK